MIGRMAWLQCTVHAFYGLNARSSFLFVFLWLLATRRKPLASCQPPISMYFEKNIQQVLSVCSAYFFFFAGMQQNWFGHRHLLSFRRIWLGIIEPRFSHSSRFQCVVLVVCVSVWVSDRVCWCSCACVIKVQDIPRTFTQTSIARKRFNFIVIQLPTCSNTWNTLLTMFSDKKFTHEMTGIFLFGWKYLGRTYQINRAHYPWALPPFGTFPINFALLR